MENARLYSEAEARTRELSTLLEVSRNVTSMLELRPLLTLILEQLSVTVDYAGANIFDVEGDVLRTLAMRRFGESVTGALRQYWLDEVPANREVIERKTALIIDDIHGESPMAKMFRSVWDRGLAEKFAPIHSWLGVPLVARDNVIGMLSVEHTERGHWQQRDADLVTAFATQAATAIENARLFERAETRANEMEALSRVASTLSVDQPTSETLDAIASRVVEGTRAVACSVTLMGGPKDFRLAGSAGLEADYYDTVVAAIANGADSPTVDAFRTGRRQVVRDARSRMLAEPMYAPVHHAVQNATWETVVITPLVSGGRKLGTLGTYYERGYQPDEEELSLIAAIADQAAISVENRRLFAETERRLRESQALVRVASSLTFEQQLERRLDMLAENLVAGTGAVASLVAMVDPDGHPQVAGSYGLPEAYATAIVESWSGGVTAETARTLEDHRTRILRDARAGILSDPLYAPIHGYMAGVEWDTVAILPVVYEGRSVGTLNAYYLKDMDPDETEKELLHAIADQAAVAFENARLFAEAERRIRDVEALYKADERLHQSLKLEDVLQSLVDVAVDVLQADKSLVVNFDSTLDRLFVRIARGYSEATIEAANQALAQMPADILASRTEPLAIEDAANDPRSIRVVTASEGIGSFIDVPIVIGGQVFGLFDVAYTKPRTFSASDKRLLAALTQRAAVAIDNARLYGRSQRAASLEERQRLARELHDSVSQALYGIALGAKTARTQLDRDPSKVAEPLDYVLTLAEAGLAELRSLIFELRPESLEMEGIIAALQKQFAALQARHGIEVVAELGDEPDLPIELKEVIFRVAQEALHNTVKHARATRVEVRLEQKPGSIALCVADDGQGFDPNGDFPGHLGLRSMAERALNVGGSVSIDSGAGRGTEIRLEIPLAVERIG
jgi:GAF domain-containing protein